MDGFIWFMVWLCLAQCLHRAEASTTKSVSYGTGCHQKIGANSSLVWGVKAHRNEIGRPLNSYVLSAPLSGRTPNAFMLTLL
jgi:hypothetical protein